MDFSLRCRVQTGSGAQQPPIRRVPGDSFSGLKRWGVKLTTRLHIVPRLRMRGGVFPLPQYVFMAWYLLKHKDNFTFYSYGSEINGTGRCELDSFGSG
jgi:hypothetical protein